MKPLPLLWPEYDDIDDMKTDQESLSELNEALLGQLISFISSEIDDSDDSISKSACQQIVDSSRSEFGRSREESGVIPPDINNEVLPDNKTGMTPEQIWDKVEDFDLPASLNSTMC